MMIGRGKINKQLAMDTFLSMLEKHVTVERQHIIVVFNTCSDMSTVNCCLLVCELNLIRQDNSDANDRVMELKYASQLLNVINNPQLVFNVVDYAILVKVFNSKVNVSDLLKGILSCWTHCNCRHNISNYESKEHCRKFSYVCFNFGRLY